MRQKTDLVALLLYLTVLGLFVAAGVVGFTSDSSNRVVGVVLMAVGAGAITFARALTVAQRQLAERPFIPVHGKEIRPLTFVLWGVGVFIVGIARVWIW